MTRSLRIISAFTLALLIPTVLGIPVLRSLDAAAPRPGSVTLVRHGEPLAVFASGDDWTREGSTLVGSGLGKRLGSEYSLGAGDFRIETRLSIDALERTAATFVLAGESHFGLDGGEGGSFFTEGPLYGGGPTIGARSDQHIIPGTLFTFVAERKRGTIHFTINGNELHRFEHRGSVFGIAWRPHRGTLRIESWTLEGNLDRVPPPLPKGYSIPVIDLSSQKRRQVIVDREAGQYLGHPTTVLLEDGKTMICVYPKGHGKGAIVMKRSSDGGRTWSERLPTPENWATSQETPTIHRVVAPDGTKRLIIFSGLHPIRRALSDDDGRTWTPLEPIGPWGGIVAMGALEHLKDGTIAAWFHDDGRFFRPERSPFRFDVFQTLSRDGGLTWEEPRSIAHRPDVHLCEPGCVRSPDGKTIALLLRENSRTRNSFVIFSTDEGQTWSEPRELPAALTGDRHTAVYTPEGRLFISFRDTTRVSKTAGDWVAWIGRWEDIVAGTEGEYRVRLMDNHVRGDCAYPGVVIFPDGEIVTTTYGHWVEGESPFIVSVRLKVADIVPMGHDF